MQEDASPIVKCAVIGHPIAHSLSPAIHQAGYDKFGLNWRFEAIDVPPEGFDDFISKLDNKWRGLSVTMPHKVSARFFGLADEVAELTGVANTIIFDQVNRVNRVYNTDVTGFKLACQQNGIDQISSIAVVGNGATARSVLVGAYQLSCVKAVICVRDIDRAQPLVSLGQKLGMQVQVQLIGEQLPEVDLLASTIPANATASLTKQKITAGAVFDAIYDPWPTGLAQLGQSQHIPVINGLDLLAGQAVKQFHLMTGEQCEFSFFRSAGWSALAASPNC